MPIIISIIAIMFIILIGWTWSSLGNVNKKQKIIYIICGIVVVYIFTSIIYGISKIGIVYESQEAKHLIQRIFVLIFTIINGYLLLPYIFKKIDEINNDEIQKETFYKSIKKIIIGIIVLLIIEIVYFKNIQNGILKMK